MRNEHTIYFFALTLMLMGCSGDNTTMGGNDDLSSGGGEDMAMTGGDDLSMGGGDMAGSGDMSGMGTKTTIRDMNTMKVMPGTTVTFSGVVTSPAAIPAADQMGMACTYTIIVGQPDNAPTLQDGIHVVQRVATMNPTQAGCVRAGAMLASVTAKMGDALDITGTFVAMGMMNARREVTVNNMGTIKNNGAAAMAPKPVTTMTSALQTRANFAAASAALVQFNTVQTSNLNMGNRTFQVSPAGMNNNLVLVEPLYLGANYMPPRNGTRLTSIVGIVDVVALQAATSNGAIYPRVAADIK